MKARKQERVSVLLTDDEKREIDAAAAAMSLPTSAYIRMIVLRAAREE